MAFNTHGTFAMQREHHMLKNTLIAAFLVASGFTAFAQTAAVAAKPAASAPVVVAPAKTASATPAAAPAMGAKASTDEPAVKKSKNDICHDKTSSGYAQTKNFKPFATMDECVKSGGRPPKGNAK
jgi:hypothetical protein